MLFLLAQSLTQGKSATAGDNGSIDNPDNVSMEKAANGYEYDAYENTDADSNNQNNKPLTIESRNGEGQGGGNDVDVYNKGSDDSNNGSNGIDTDNSLEENNQADNNTANVSNVSSQENTDNADTNTSNVNSDGSYGNESDNSSQGIANGDEMGYKGDIRKATSELVKKSTCTADELSNYLRILDTSQGTSYSDNYLKNGIWPDNIRIPKNSSVLTADGDIDWQKVLKGGYEIDEAGNAIKEKHVPKIGEIVDRYGPPNGRYVSPVINGKSYTYEQRNLPFVEDEYHKYKVIGDFNKISEHVSKCTNTKLKSLINDYVAVYYNGDYSKVFAYKGKIKAIKGWGTEGGMQNEYPMKIEWLVEIGLLKEI